MKSPRIDYRFDGKESRWIVTINTDRLIIASVVQSDIDDYINLFQNEKCIQFYGSGKSQEKEQIVARVDDYVTRWRDSLVSGFSIRLLDSTFVGHIILGNADQLDSSELAYVISDEFWNKGIGSEAVGAMVTLYYPVLKEKYGLKRICATVNPDNAPSWKILTKLGFKNVETIPRFGTLRHLYVLEN